MNVIASVAGNVAIVQTLMNMGEIDGYQATAYRIILGIYCTFMIISIYSE